MHVSGESGGSRQLSIGRIASHLVRDDRLPKPALIILAGFCWADPQKATVGDIILASTIYSLNQQRIGPEASSRIELPYVSTLSIDSDFLSALRSSLTQIQQDLTSEPLASLETHFANNDARDALLKNYPQIAGGEMGGYHFLPDRDAIPWIIVKAVSDFGGNEVSREHQRHAAQRVAEVFTPLLALLPKFGKLADPRVSSDVLLLTDAILGSTIVITATETNAHGLNDYLNDVIGPRVDLKLQKHSSDLELGENFPVIFCDLILELAQNSFLHGRAGGVFS